MKVLFAIRATQHFIYFRSIIESLAQRGQTVKVLFDKRWSKEQISTLAKIKNVQFAWAPYDPSRWRKVIFYFRDLLSLRRFYQVTGQSAYYLKRWEQMILPFKLYLLLRLSPAKRFILSNYFAAFVRICEWIMPDDPEIIHEIKSFKPDVLLASPCNFSYISCDVEYLKHAKKLKIPAILPVFSWDNLTTKGLIPIKPDYLFVWNKTQVTEARIHHNIPEEKCVTAGAPFFDIWFKKYKPTPKEVFFKRLKLNPGQPVVLYLVSSEGVADEEYDVVANLRHMLDSATDNRLKEIQIIVRPHPANERKWKPGHQITVFPRNSDMPTTKSQAQDFFDSAYYSFAVLGINTSAMIQAVILDKPVIGMLVKKWQERQTQALHFQQLIKGGAITLADEQDIAKTIKAMLDGKDTRKKQRQEFVGEFIRPLGLKVAAGEKAALEIEKIAYAAR